MANPLERVTSRAFQRNPLLAWRWERSSAYTSTNVILTLCIGYALWGTSERLLLANNRDFRHHVAAIRQFFSLIAVIAIQVITALGCTYHAVRHGRVRVADIIATTPMTERQARVALIEWPMHKVLYCAMAVAALILIPIPLKPSDVWYLIPLGVLVLAWGAVWGIFAAVQEKIFTSVRSRALP